MEKNVDTYWIKYISREMSREVKADLFAERETSHDVFVYSRNAKIVALVPKEKAVSTELTEDEKKGTNLVAIS